MFAGLESRVSSANVYMRLSGDLLALSYCLGSLSQSQFRTVEKRSFFEYPRATIHK